MVNAKHEDGKFYGAFVSYVNDDGTYQVYFVEDSTKRDNVKHNDIKIPLVSARQKSFGHWDKYKGKVFYDAGTVADEESDSEAEDFAPGEFVVKGVAANDNFLCLRVGTQETSTFDIGYVLRRIRKYEEE